MKEYSIKRLITLRSLSILAIAIILIILLVLLPVNKFITDKIYNLAQEAAQESVVSLVKQFDNSLLIIGKAYDPSLEQLLTNYASNLEQQAGNQITHQQLLSQLETTKQEVRLPGGLKQGKLRCYLINPAGEIIDTNHSSALGLDFADFPELWGELAKLEPGETFIQRLTYSKYSGKPRKYGYIKLANGYILELAIALQAEPFEQLSLDLKKLKQELHFVNDLALYDGQFTPVEQVFSLPTSKDRKYFKQLLALETNKKRVITFDDRLNLYICWKSEVGGQMRFPQKYLIKVGFNFSELERFKKILLGLVAGLTLLVGSIIIYFSNNLYKRLVNPFSRLTESMQEASLQDITLLNVEIERTDIKEVNTLLATYQDLASELSASFQELEAINNELEASYEEVDNLNKRLEKLLQMPEEIAETVFDEEEKFLNQLLKTASELVPEADYGSIYTIDGEDWEFAATIGHDLKTLKSLPLKVDYIPDFNQATFLTADDILEYSKSKMPSQIFEKFSAASKPIKSTIMAKLELGGQQVGGVNLDLAADSSQEFKQETLKIMDYFSKVASAFVTMQRYNQMEKKFQKKIIFAIINMLELHDKYTKGHSENVAEISAAIARELEFKPEQINQVYWAGLVHDIGKILINKDILNKPSGLNAEEYNEIKNHSRWGAKVLSNSEELTEIAHCIRHHHEHWDGSGYPDGLQKDEIPLISQIIGVADAWDAMRSSRVYRDSLSKEVAMQELKNNKGIQFAPRIVEALLQLIKKGEL